MRKLPPATYQTPEEVEAEILRLQAAADGMQPGSAKQSILIDIAKLRAYADMKRWVSGPKR